MSINLQNIPKEINGDNILFYMTPQQVKSIQGYQDLPSLYSWYKEDPDKNHMGMMSLWGQQAQQTRSIYRELLETRSIMEVNGWDGKFSYDLPIENHEGCYTTRDMSAQPYPGIDGNNFEIVLSQEFTTGDILTNDPEFGQQIIVSGEEPVRMEGDGFVHTVKLVDNDKETFYLQSNLAKGLTYYKIGHAILGQDYGTNFSHVEMPNSVGYMRCEYQLGSLRGVEAYVTGAADSKSMNFAAASSKMFKDKLEAEANSKGELAVMMNLVSKNGYKVPDVKTARIGATMEFLVHRELEKLTAHQLLFQKAGVIRDGNGNARLNEGLWHQLRRGKIIRYGRPGGITRAHLKEAVEYIFRNNPEKPTIQRRIKFKAGREARKNILEIFAEELKNQTSLLTAAGYLRQDNLIPNPIYRTDNDPNMIKLGIKPVQVETAYIPDIGMLEIEEDPALNYLPFGDRFQQGFHPQGMAHTAYSLVIWDVEDQQYSNNQDLPQGAKLIDGGNAGSNIFLVKPQGEMTYWGRSNGRYDITKAGDIVSSKSFIGQEFWAYNSMGIWVKDITKFIMIELDPKARKGFN